MKKKAHHLLEPLVRRDRRSRQNGPGMEQPPVRRATASPEFSETDAGTLREACAEYMRAAWAGNASRLGDVHKVVRRLTERLWKAAVSKVEDSRATNDALCDGGPQSIESK
jgi:hypothetical protein